MGMFDDIECKYPLPQPEDPKGFKGETYFQTKDLESCLDKYEIREDGTLWVHKVEYEYPENLTDKDVSWGDISLDIKEKRSWWEPVNTTRTIKMYNSVYSEDEYDYWIVYEVTFIDGKVTKTIINKFETWPNSERKKLHEENINKLKAWGEYTKTKRYKYIHKPYQSVVKFVFKKLLRCLEKTTTSLFKLEMYLLR